MRFHSLLLVFIIFACLHSVASALDLSPSWPVAIPAGLTAFSVPVYFSGGTGRAVAITCDLLSPSDYAWFGKGVSRIPSSSSGQLTVRVSPAKRLTAGRSMLIKCWTGNDPNQPETYVQQEVTIGSSGAQQQRQPQYNYSPDQDSPVSAPAPVQPRYQSQPPAPVPIPSPTYNPSTSSSPFSSASFYVDRSSPTSSISGVFGSTAHGIWLGSDWISNPTSHVKKICNAAKRAGKVPILVVYSIPHRDCGGYSAGGSQSRSDYLRFVSGVASGIGDSQALVVLEPDALAHAAGQCSGMQSERISIIREALQHFRSTSPNAAVYVDIGHARWLSAAEAARLLRSVGATQFALNVANFVSTAESVRYGDRIAASIGGGRYVIDTSRNGAGAQSTFCNPPGAALGAPSTGQSGFPNVDALVWIKVPGESDGSCRPGAPAAGQFWRAYANLLISNAMRSKSNNGFEAEMNEADSDSDSHYTAPVESDSDSSLSAPIQVDVEVNLH